jgi:hypothetical protein
VVTLVVVGTVVVTVVTGVVTVVVVVVWVVPVVPVVDVVEVSVVVVLVVDVPVVVVPVVVLPVYVTYAERLLVSGGPEPEYGVSTAQLPLPFCDMVKLPLTVPLACSVAAVTVLPPPPGVNTQWMNGDSSPEQALSESLPWPVQHSWPGESTHTALALLVCVTAAAARIPPVSSAATAPSASHQRGLLAAEPTLRI